MSKQAAWKEPRPDWLMDSPKEQVANSSGLLPLGHAVLVQTYEPEVRSSIIELPPDVAGRMSQIEQRCIVVAVGPECWKEERFPRAKPGDRVLVTKFAGYIASGNLTQDGQTYRVVNDRDIFCKIEWSEQK